MVVGAVLAPRWSANQIPPPPIPAYQPESAADLATAMYPMESGPLTQNVALVYPIESEPLTQNV